MKLGRLRWRRRLSPKKLIRICCTYPARCLPWTLASQPFGLAHVVLSCCAPHLQCIVCWLVTTQAELVRQGVVPKHGHCSTVRQLPSAGPRCHLPFACMSAAFVEDSISHRVQGGWTLWVYFSVRPRVVSGWPARAVKLASRPTPASRCLWCMRVTGPCVRPPHPSRCPSSPR
jgi:hypothetical protein